MDHHHVGEGPVPRLPLPMEHLYRTQPNQAPGTGLLGATSLSSPLCDK